MSRRSGSGICRRACDGARLGLLAAALALVAACGTQGTRPAEPAARADTAASGAAASSGDVARDAAETAGDVAAKTAGDVPAAPIEVPERASAAFSRALAAMAAGDWLAAELELDQLTAEFPAFPGPYVNLAIIYRRDGRLAEAETALSAALRIAPEHAAANNELGVVLRERGEFAEAEAAYRRAIAGDAGYALAHFNLGVLLDLYLKRESEALTHYETYQSLVPEPDPEVALWIVDLRRRLGLPAETVQLAQEDGR